MLIKFPFMPDNCIPNATSPATRSAAQIAFFGTRNYLINEFSSAFWGERKEGDNVISQNNNLLGWIKILQLGRAQRVRKRKKEKFLFAFMSAQNEFVRPAAAARKKKSSWHRTTKGRPESGRFRLVFSYAACFGGDEKANNKEEIIAVIRSNWAFFQENSFRISPTTTAAREIQRWRRAKEKSIGSNVCDKNIKNEGKLTRWATALWTRTSW
jgi:hypothetical protein